MEAQSKCSTCRHSYQGADLSLRCRINGLLAGPENADGCKRFEYEPGTDAIESASWCWPMSRQEAESRN